MGSNHFTQLIVCQRANEVRGMVFDATEKFPVHHRFGLARQMQEAAHSIPSKIAEGFGRRRPRDKANFYAIAKGSAEELSDSIMFAHSRGYWADIVVVSGMLDEVGRMLRRLIRKTYDMGS